MLARMGIRFVALLVGILIGIVASVALLSGFSATTQAIVVSTLLFWVVNLVVNFVALRVLLRQPAVSDGGPARARLDDRVAAHRQIFLSMGSRSTVRAPT